MKKFGLSEIVTEVLAAAVSSLAAFRLNLLSKLLIDYAYQLEFRGVQGSDITHILELLEKSIPEIKVVRVFGPYFKYSDLAGMLAYVPGKENEEDKAVRIPTAIQNAIKTAHEQGKVVIFYIEYADQLTEEGRIALKKLISPYIRKQDFDIDGPIVVVMSGDPEKRGFSLLDEDPTGQPETRLTIVLELDVKTLTSYSKIKEIVASSAKDINLNQVLSDIIKKGNYNARHPFNFAFFMTYKEKLKRLIEDKEEVEIAGIYKRINTGMLNYLELHLPALEGVKGKLTKEDIERTFYGFMGDEIASLAAKVYDQIYEAGAYDYVEKCTSLSYKELMDSIKTGDLMKHIKEKQNLSSALFVTISLRNRILSQYSSLSEKARLALALTQYLAFLVEQDNILSTFLIDKTIFKVVYGSPVPKESEEIEKKLNEALYRYYTGDGEDLEKDPELRDFNVDIFPIAFSVLYKMANDESVEMDNRLRDGIRALHKIFADVSDMQNE